jgi:hypothetical protein
MNDATDVFIQQNPTGNVHFLKALKKTDIYQVNLLLHPLTPNNLYRRRAVSPLKIKIPCKNMREKPTYTPIIHSSLDTTRPSTIFYRLLLK